MTIASHAVAITGLGAVTPMGVGTSSVWDALLAGRRGLSKLTKFDPTGLRNDLCGQVNDWTFSADEFGIEHEPDEAVQFLMVAAREAWDDAAPEPDCRVGAVLATNFGGSTSWEDYMASVLGGSPTPELFSQWGFAGAIGPLGRVFPIDGPAIQLSMACASGSAAIIYAAELIREGQADVIICGGYDSLAQSQMSGLSLLHTMTDDDLRPFSANRSGTLFGEGAAVLVLEDMEHARARGARCYCTVLGGCQNNNAYHLTAPDEGGAGMARVLQGAIENASISPERVSHINAHGTGTEYHDVAETQAIKAVLGHHAYEIPVVSIKGAMSHLMGAAGTIEGIVTALSLHHQMVPPTTNYSEPDPECDLDYVISGPRVQPMECAASISAGIGGDNACVIFGAADIDATVVTP